MDKFEELRIQKLSDWLTRCSGKSARYPVSGYYNFHISQGINMILLVIPEFWGFIHWVGNLPTYDERFGKESCYFLVMVRSEEEEGLVISLDRQKVEFMRFDWNTDFPFDLDLYYLVDRGSRVLMLNSEY